MTLKVGFYAHGIDFAGTWRSHERLVQEIERDARFETYILYAAGAHNNRLDVARALLSRTRFVPFDRSQEKTGPDGGYTPLETDFSPVCRGLALDVLHFARSGYFEWPFNERHARLQIETNIFGYDDSSPYLDRSIAIAGVVARRKTRPPDAVIPNPIPSRSADYASLPDLRTELGLASGDLVLGRLGRPANFHPIALAAYAKSRRRLPHLRYVIVGGCDEAERFVRDHRIEGVRFAPTTNDDAWIERFHKTIDVFAHYRSDGEVHSTAIAQALVYDVPVITHRAGTNGQIETVGPGGVCVRSGWGYARALARLCRLTPVERRRIGSLGREYTLQRSSQRRVGMLVADKYVEWFASGRDPR